MYLLRNIQAHDLFNRIFSALQPRLVAEWRVGKVSRTISVLDVTKLCLFPDYEDRDGLQNVVCCHPENMLLNLFAVKALQYISRFTIMLRTA